MSGDSSRLSHFWVKSKHHTVLFTFGSDDSCPWFTNENIQFPKKIVLNHPIRRYLITRFKRSWLHMKSATSNIVIKYRRMWWFRTILFSYRKSFKKSNILLSIFGKILKVQGNSQSFNDFWKFFRLKISKDHYRCAIWFGLTRFFQNFLTKCQEVLCTSVLVAHFHLPFYIFSPNILRWCRLSADNWIRN